MSLKLEEIEIDELWQYKVCKDCKEIVKDEIDRVYHIEDNPKGILTYCKKCAEDEFKRAEERKKEARLKWLKQKYDDMKAYIEA